MAKVYEFLANGFEEIEGLAPVDILRRGGVDIKTVSITGSEWVETSHGITVKADLKFEDIQSFEDVDMLLLPGGLPGSTNLNEHEGVRQALIAQHKAGKRVGAICAAPMASWKARRRLAPLASSVTSVPTPNTRASFSRRMAT